jgi:ComF family protein
LTLLLRAIGTAASSILWPLALVNLESSMWLTKLLAAAEGWAFPPHCVACGAAGAAPGFDLCNGCEADLPPWHPPAPTQAASDGPLDELWSAFTYDFPVDALIRDLKYRGQLSHASVLGQATARCWLRQHARPPAVDALLPVPLHAARLRERGFNQSVEIARPLSRLLELPLLQGVAVRRRATSPQTALSAEQRLHNLHGAFAVRRPVRGLRIALLDDVITTGATLNELAGVLRAAGAVRVTALSVARAA